MPGVQPATRRLLTESNAAAAYVPLSSRGVANGVPTLGADGKVPSAQLPLSTSPVARLSAAVTGAQNVTADVLVLTLPVGTWTLDSALYMTPTSITPSLAATGGLVAGTALLFYSGMGTSAFQNGTTTGLPATSPVVFSNALVRITGVVTVTTAGTLTVRAVGTSTSGVTVAAGSWIRAVGA